MAEPILLYGLGATKAGTSWLYRVLHDRPDCHVHPVKETHYWDSVEPGQLRWQVDANQRNKEGMHLARARALLKGNEVRAGKMARQIAAMERLNFMLVQDRTDHAAYGAYLRLDAPPDTKVIAEICPAYSLLARETYREMAALAADARFLYLLRDPVSRLWSAVRMQAVRSLKPGQDLVERANQILTAVVDKGKHPQITDRGDYAEILPRLRTGIPDGALKIMYFEHLLTDNGYGELCDWLGIYREPAWIEKKVHGGAKVDLDPGLRARALDLMRPQYDAVAEHVGALPENWIKALKGD